MAETKDKIKDFSEYTPEEQEKIILTLQKYLVRKQISETNKELREIFGSMGSDYTESVARCFTKFNSYFMGTDLYSFIDKYEGMSESSYFYKSDEERMMDKFTYDIACSCLSKAPGERIPNRVILPIMVAYADMQKNVLSLLYTKKYRFSDILETVSTEIRDKYYEKYGKELNQSVIQPIEEAHKFNTKSNCKKWSSFLIELKKRISSMEISDIKELLEEMLYFTQTDRARLETRIELAHKKAIDQVKSQRESVSKMSLSNGEDDINLQFNEYANLADYDEYFSSDYESEMVDYYQKKDICDDIDILLDEFMKKVQKNKSGTQPGDI